MTIASWPIAIVPQQIDWALEYNTISFTSPLTKSVQTIEMPGARWKAQVKLSSMPRSKWATFSAFLNNLRGQAGRFYFYPYHGLKPLGNSTTTANIKIVGATNTGTTMQTSGWTSSSTVLHAGDFLSVTTSIGVELKQVVSDIVSDATGNATISFCPALRNSPLNESAVILDTPKCIMMLENDDQTTGAFTPPCFGAYSISMLEVIYA